MLPSSISSSVSPTIRHLLLLLNVQCPCQRYVMGGDSAWDHINSLPPP
jgi:hypothetical protein